MSQCLINNVLRSLFVGFFISITYSVSSQTGPRDTSFSVYSTYIKTKKKYPDITIANPPTPAGIKIKNNIVFSKIGARKLYVDIFYPEKKTATKYPAVLLIFGGGWRSGERSHNTPTAKLLAGAGYIAVSADYRLSTEATYPAAVHDLKTAVRWMRANARRYNIDTNKIAVWGCSAGGQLAAFLGTTNKIKKFEGSGGFSKFSSRVDAIIDVDGTLAFIHPESGEGDDSKGRSAATNWFGYSKTERPDLWHEAAPLNHLGTNTPPILFINSSVDRMHAGRDDAIKKLSSLGIYTEVRVFPEVPHPFWLFNPWFQPTVNYTITFLDKIFKK